MKFQVVIESPRTAVVKAEYLNKDFQYVFLDVLFTPATAASTIVKGKGEFTFASVHFQPPLAIGDPMRHKIIRSEFHRRTDVHETVKASSLEEACAAFFTPFQDTFEISTPAPKRPVMAATKKPLRTFREIGAVSRKGR